MIVRKQGRLMLPVAAMAVAALIAVLFSMTSYNPTGFTVVRIEGSTNSIHDSSQTDHSSKTSSGGTTIPHTDGAQLSSSSSSATFTDMFTSNNNNGGNHPTPPGILLVMEEEGENNVIPYDDVIPPADPLPTTTSFSSSSSSSSNSSSSSLPPNTSFLDALSMCNTLECLRDAHLQPHDDLFNFPHFIIIGFQKTATNSLYKYLLTHPEIIPPSTQEPDFFTYECQSRPPEYCPAGDVKKYISRILPRTDFIEKKGLASTFEASTHIVRQGALLSPRLRLLMPWLKIVICIREPINRAAAMLIHNYEMHQKGCLQRKQLSHCLLKESQIAGALDGPTSYTESLRPWLEGWPKEQIHIIQYEELQQEEGEMDELHRLKEFIGINTSLPETSTAKSGIGGGILGLRVSRSSTNGIGRTNEDMLGSDTAVDGDDDIDIDDDIGTGGVGWVMRKEQYEELIDHVSPDVRGLMQLLEAHGKLKDKGEWMNRWQKVWDDTLLSCENEEMGCSIMY